MFTIDSIVWPKQPSDALYLYRGFLVQAVDTIGIMFPDDRNNPVHIVRNFLSGVPSEEARVAALSFWWHFVDSRDAIRNFQDKEVLIARVAICLLSVTEKDVYELCENLSWFLEVLGFLGADVDKVIETMGVYFKPS